MASASNNFADYSLKPSVCIVYTGEGKGKTSAALGLMCRALGSGHKVAFIQFIKHWEVGEHKFIQSIQPLFKDQLLFYKGGAGFYNAGNMSAKDISQKQHQDIAKKTLKLALKTAASGKYNLVICDEISNAQHEGLIAKGSIKTLLEGRHGSTSICLTGRDFPKTQIKHTDIATNMTKLKHHFDSRYLANPGIDY